MMYKADEEVKRMQQNKEIEMTQREGFPDAAMAPNDDFFEVHDDGNGF